MKQPVLGIAASVLVMGIAMGFISLFSFATFGTWVCFFTICFIPIEVVIGITWGSQHPQFAGTRSQPAKGILLILTALAIGAVVAAVHYPTVGGGLNPPRPMLMMCLITSVVVTFWLTIMWGGWPFTSLIKSPLGAGLAILTAAYVINYLFFRIFFNYSFMVGAPVYAASLDPHGMFNAWNATVFYVTAIAAMFLMLNFDLWPLTKWPPVMRQPVLGIVWTGAILVLGAVAFYLGVNVAGMDVVQFMVQVPIPFIFGTIIVLNMLQNSLFGKLGQPAAGLLNAIASTVIGVVLARIYASLGPSLSGPLNVGAPAYDAEIWLASALLAVTFPFLIFFAEFFQMWPLRKVEQSKAASR